MNTLEILGLLVGSTAAVTVIALARFLGTVLESARRRSRVGR